MNIEYGLCSIKDFPNIVQQHVDDNPDWNQRVTINPNFAEDLAEIIRVCRKLDLRFDLRDRMCDRMFIAGGMLSRLISGEHRDVHNQIQGDIDIFCLSKFWALDHIQNLKTKKCAVESESSNSCHFGIPTSSGYYIINIVKSVNADTPTKLLNTFDFHVCQMATDGVAIIYSSAAIYSLVNKYLTFNMESQALDDGASLGRIAKYGSRNYKLTYKSAHDMIQYYRNKDTIIQMEERSNQNNTNTYLNS